MQTSVRANANATATAPSGFSLALNAGCRRDELLRLEWQRVDLQAELIHLEPHHTKSGKRRSVPLNGPAREAIAARAAFREQHCPVSPWVFCDGDGNRVQSIKRSWATACRRAGIEDFRIHDLRHLCSLAGVGRSAADRDPRSSRPQHDPDDGTLCTLGAGERPGSGRPVGGKDRGKGAPKRGRRVTIWSRWIKGDSRREGLSP